MAHSILTIRPSPEELTWFDTHALAANEGIAVASTVCFVNVAQKDCAASRRPGVWVALNARRQLSALQSPAA